MGEGRRWPLFHLAHGALLWLPGYQRGRALPETNSLTRQRKLGSTDANGKQQIGSPASSKDAKTQTVAGYKQRAPTAAADALHSNLKASVPPRRLRKLCKSSMGRG